jgi:hypothetical protein
MPKSSEGYRAFQGLYLVCPNAECQRFSLNVSLFENNADRLGTWRPGRPLHSWQLLPVSNAKVFPDFVPEAVRQDYEESCLIKNLSPKASATLSRRALQGMIRNFWGAKPRRLVDEIEEIKGKVDPDVWDAIQAVRKIGNIGAHMEKDVNLIIDVEPEEAERLIWLIEFLVKEWYIARETRKAGLAEITALAATKEALQKS